MLVGADAGLEGEASLRHTHADVERVRAVLTELGGFAANEIQVMRDVDAAGVAAALAQQSRRTQPVSTFLFYFSGHADSGALHLGGTTLPVATLLEAIAKVPATLRISIVDACQSGALTQAKGLSPGPPFFVQLDERAADGQIFISSSARDEASFESTRLGGALFTLHFTTGLRGAADRNVDARVTVSEAYEYAYAQTLRQSLLSPSGPQHPSFRWDFAGRHDPVLTLLDTSSALTLRADTEGEYVIFDADENAVQLELLVRGKQEQRFALAPGEYVVKKHGASDLRSARIRLTAGRDAVLEDYQMRAVPWASLASKGDLGTRWIAASVGQAFSAIAGGGDAQGAVSLEWEGPRWLVAFTADLERGSSVSHELRTDLASVAAGAYALFTARTGPASLRFGPGAALGLLVQSPDHRPTAYALATRLEGRVRFELEVSTQAMLTAGGALAGVCARTDEGVGLRLGHFSLMPTVRYDLGLRVSW